MSQWCNVLAVRATVGNCVDDTEWKMGVALAIVVESREKSSCQTRGSYTEFAMAKWHKRRGLGRANIS